MLKKEISQEDIMALLDTCYDKSLNGIGKVSLSVKDMADDYLKKYDSVDEACRAIFTVFKLIFKLAWGVAKICALLLSILAIPIMIGCLLFVGGVLLLLPIVMLMVAMVIIKS